MIWDLSFKPKIVRYFRDILQQKFYLILTVVGTDSKNKRNDYGH